MGSYKSKNLKKDATKQQRLQPEPNYVVKTRAPVTNGTWRNNLMRGIRQDQLRDQAMGLARRKCYDPIMTFGACQKKEGPIWVVFNCQQQFYYVSKCLEHEYNVEMDKRRRDMTRNTQSWWRSLYDQNGEIGEQAEMKNQNEGLFDYLKRVTTSNKI